MEDEHSFEELALYYSQYLSAKFHDEDDRQIEVIDLYGGPLEIFFLLRYNDTQQMFCLSAQETIHILSYNRF